MFTFSNDSIPVKITTHMMSIQCSLTQIQLNSIGDSDQVCLLHGEVAAVHSNTLRERLGTPEFTSNRIFDHENFDLLNAIKTYMYTGNLIIKRNQLIWLIDAAYYLGLHLLLEDIATNITFESDDEIIELLCQSLCMPTSPILTKVFDKFIKCFNTMCIQKILNIIHNLKFDMMKQLAASTDVHHNADSEVKLAMCIAKWCTPKSFHEFPMDEVLIEYIKFDLISFNDLLNKIKPLNLLSSATYITLIEAKALEMDLALTKVSAMQTSVNIYDQFYVCNINNAIPNTHRVITVEEFNTDAFKQNFLNLRKKSLKNIGFVNSKCRFLIVNSHLNIIYNNRAIIIDMISDNEYKLNTNDFLLKDIFNLQVDTRAICDLDAYLCVKI